MLAFALFALITGAPQQDARITVRQPGLRADIAFERIGELFGTKLTVGSDLADEAILIYLPDTTFEEFRIQTAAGLNASWRETDGGWQLRRSGAQR